MCIRDRCVHILIIHLMVKPDGFRLNCCTLQQYKIYETHSLLVENVIETDVDPALFPGVIV